MNKLQSLISIQARLMGFALAVKDLEELNQQMPPKLIIQSLIDYATEYELTKGMINETAN